MRYATTGLQIGPPSTPSTVRALMLWIGAVCLATALLHPLFIYVFGPPGPLDWLSLSWWGMRRLFLWQPLTSLFVMHTGQGGIHFFFLLTLFFNLYLLWIFGSEIHERVGRAPFLRLFFISGVVSGLIALLLMPIVGLYSILSGPTPSILALLIAWTLMHPERELLLFFLIPVKAKWLTLGIIAAILLVNLSNLSFISLFLYLSATLIGYIYSLTAWGLHSPFPFLYKFELWVIRLGEKIRQKVLKFIPSKKKKSNGKIFDIDTGDEIVKDEEFIDRMLEKISRHGEKSLTWKEKKRMQEISEKKKRS